MNVSHFSSAASILAPSPFQPRASAGMPKHPQLCSVASAYSPDFPLCFFFPLFTFVLFGFTSGDSSGRIIADMMVAPVNMGSSGLAETLLIVLPIFLLLSFG
tara:strand:- start:98 stop:403 length:306 start_codon:yes stop_codon:yes gene_type:complete